VVPVEVVRLDVLAERLEDRREVRAVLRRERPVVHAIVQELDRRAGELLEVVLRPLREDEVVRGIAVVLVDREDVLEGVTLHLEVLAPRRDDVVARHGLDEGLLRRREPVPDLLVHEHPGDEELLLPAGEVDVADADRARVVHAVEELRDVVERRRELEPLELARLHRLHERAAARDGGDELDVLRGDLARGDEVVARAAEHVLGGRQVAQRPGLLAEALEAEAAHALHVSDREREVARELLGARDDRDRHDVPAVRVEDRLEEREARPVAVHRLPVEEAEELVERRAERHARVVDEAPCLVELAGRRVRRVEAAARGAGADRRDQVAAELGRDGGDAGEPHEADLVRRAERGVRDGLQLFCVRLRLRPHRGGVAEAAEADVGRLRRAGRERDGAREQRSLVTLHVPLSLSSVRRRVNRAAPRCPHRGGVPARVPPAPGSPPPTRPLPPEPPGASVRDALLLD
jgi:hypothetical protein